MKKQDKINKLTDEDLELRRLDAKTRSIKKRTAIDCPKIISSFFFINCLSNATSQNLAGVDYLRPSTC